jgi:predicted transglutaminase-like cysteine proteinase
MITSAKKWHRRYKAANLLGALGASALLSQAPAQAALPPVALVAALHCNSPAPAAFTNPVRDQDSLGQSKAAAILGGQQSALDLISARQSDQNAEAFVPAAAPAAAWQSSVTFCSPAWSAHTTSRDTFDPPAIPSDDFLGSARISIGRTPFDHAWARVSRKSQSAKIPAVFARPREVGLNEIQRVNTWVNKNITYAEDIDLYGRRDYWATANETLRNRKGDCEDYAILKYQILMHMGVAPSDMFLTLARDRIRNRDHAVLIVKMADQHYLLDNNTQELLPADGRQEYTARLSYSQNAAWLHGYTTPAQTYPLAGGTRIAHFSESAVSSARVTGLSK